MQDLEIIQLYCQTAIKYVALVIYCLLQTKHYYNVIEYKNKLAVEATC